MSSPIPASPIIAPPRRAMLTGAVFTAGYALAVSPVNAAAIATDEKGLITEEIAYPGFGGYALPAYVARPRSGKPAPVVIVVSEIFGVHAYIKDVARRFAKLGYVAIAPDYFDRAGDPAALTDFDAILALVNKAGQAQVLADTAGALAYLKTKPYADVARAGITGFCWGGNVVWMAAARVAGLKAGVAWYGRLKRPAEGRGANSPDPFPVDVAGELKIPVLGLYAEQDSGIPLSDVEAMKAALAGAGAGGPRSEIIVYPGAQHGFHADYRPSYLEPAAKDGWNRLLAWFAKNGVK